MDVLGSQTVCKSYSICSLHAVCLYDSIRDYVMSPTFLTPEEAVGIITDFNKCYRYLKAKTYKDLSDREKEILVRLRILLDL